ncbi:MAG TPA: FAD-dependent oxidoreductase [Chloroflexota bacterium]|nr:FAD-dependent oxidoreductase [Chloroflexota bacterium]
MREPSTCDVVVIGGGLAGLTAAAFLARAGRSVTVLERSSHLGGRATTQAEDGFSFNLGPHALYRVGAAARILGELGVSYTAGRLRPAPYTLDAWAATSFAGGPLTLLSTVPDSLRAGLEVAVRADPEALRLTPVRDWLEVALPDERERAALAAYIRVTTYADEPDRQSAGAVVRQMTLASDGGVLYLDGGWQTLVAGLGRAAEEAGARVVTGRRAVRVAREKAHWRVEQADGRVERAETTIVATDPRTAVVLIEAGGATPLSAWAKTAIPLKVACLTVGLSRLPRPDACFDLGVNRPLYLSVHSAFAHLAPEDGATIHVMKYLRSGIRTDPRADQRELEALLDLTQPGWREVLVQRQLLPSMTVSNALVTAAAGGESGRPAPAVPGLPGLYVVGDWVGPDGMLADAAMASARRAAALAGGERPGPVARSEVAGAARSWRRSEPGQA